MLAAVFAVEPLAGSAAPDALPALLPPVVPNDTSERAGRGSSPTTAGTGVAPTTMIGTFAAPTGPPSPLAYEPAPPLEVAAVVPL